MYFKKIGLIIFLLVVVLFNTTCFYIFNNEEQSKDDTVEEEIEEDIEGGYIFENRTNDTITINLYTPFHEVIKLGKNARRIIISDNRIEFDWIPSNSSSTGKITISEIYGSTVTFKYVSDTRNYGQIKNPSDMLVERNRYNEEYWGEWVSTTSTYYISNMTNYVKFKSSDMYWIVTAPVEKKSPNILKIGDDYVFASRVPNGSFYGRVMSDTILRPAWGVRAVTGLGGIDVVVSNLNNNANNQKTKTDSEGYFEVDGVIPGDIYEVIVDEYSVPVIPKTLDEDIGNVAIKDGINFKASIDAYLAFDNDEFTYAYGSWINKLHSNKIWYTEINLSVINPDAYNGTFLYQLVLPEGVISNSALSGTFSSNTEEIKLPIFLNCVNLNNEYEYKKINIHITSDDGTTWEDSVSLKFYKERIRFYLDNNGTERTSVSFMIRTPHGVTYTGGDSGFITIDGKSISALDIQKIYGEDYLLAIFHNRYFGDDDTLMYNFSIGQTLTPIFSGLQSDEIYNSEYNARIISPNDIIRSYVSGDMMIFYKFRF